MGYFVGTDVGGIFTDLWVAERGGRARVFKTLTTLDVMSGVMNAVQLAADYFDRDFDEFCSELERFGHETTVGLNALLTGNAASTLASPLPVLATPSKLGACVARPRGCPRWK